jgi:hypothetical protein
MVDEKVTQLPELTTPTDDDILPIIDRPASSPTTKEITKANLLAATVPPVHTHTASVVTDVRTAVAANSAVAASTAHNTNTAKPQSVTKAQVGLANAENKDTPGQIGLMCVDYLQKRSSAKPRLKRE